MAEPPQPARANSGAAGWVAAVAGKTATSSGIWGPCGCAQSSGTHTVRHFPKCPEGVQPRHAAGNSARCDGDRPGTGPLPQPAATSTATAASAAHHRAPHHGGQRLDFRRLDAARAKLTLAMAIISCHTRGEPPGAATPGLGTPARLLAMVCQPGD